MSRRVEQFDCLEVPVVVAAVERFPQWECVSNNAGAVWQSVNPLTTTRTTRTTTTTRTTSTAATAATDTCFLTPTTNTVEQLKAFSAITQISNEITVTSQVLLEAPNMFCLTRTSSCGATAPSVAYYVLPNQLTESPLCCTALHLLNGGSALRVVLVQESGVLWYWHVHAQTLDPDPYHENDNGDHAKLYTVPLAERLPEAAQTSLFWLRKAAVTFLSPSVLLLAWTPWLVAVDFTKNNGNASTANTAMATPWSATVTQEAMKARQSTITRVGYSLAQYLAISNNTVHDMPAILTLTTTSTNSTTTSTTTTTTTTTSSSSSNTMDTTALKVVYSWHDDGTLRQWIVNTNSSSSGNNNNSNALQPLAVYEYHLAVDHLSPLPLTTLEGARMEPSTIDDEGNWTLAVYPTAIHMPMSTSLSTSSLYPSLLQDDENDNFPQVYLVQGTIHVRNLYTPPMHQPTVAFRTVPSAAAILVAWQFTSNNKLQVLYQLPTQEKWQQWTYDTTMQTTVDQRQQQQQQQQDSTEPVAITQGYWDGTGEQRALQSLDLMPSITNNDLATSLEDTLHAVDQAYLLYLLRPRAVRGTGTVLPPSPGVIRQALRDLTKMNLSESLSTPSIGVQIVLALHAWRRAQHAPKSQRQAHSSSSSSSFLSPQSHQWRHTAQTPVKTPRQLYESLQQSAAETAAAMAETMATTTSPGVAASSSTANTQQQVQEHIQCWKRLLQCVWQKEATSRVILQVQWLSSSSSRVDHAVVVRGQTVSVLCRPTPRPLVDGVQGVLDNTAIRLLMCMEDQHQAQAKSLAASEQGLVQDLMHGDLALDPASCLDAVEAGLGDFESNTLWDEHIITPADANGLVLGFQDVDVTMEQHVQELQRLPLGYGLPGLNLLPLDSCQDSPFDRDLSDDLDNVHWRLSALTLTMWCLDSYRRLSLGRYMVLKYLGVRKEVSKVALWGYVQSLSLLVTCAQHVPTPLVMVTNPNSFLLESMEESKSPPKKRPSMDNYVSSLLYQHLGVTSKTTALDAYLIKKSRSDLGGHTPRSMLSFPAVISKAVFTALCAAPTQQSYDAPGLPELSLLRSITNDVTDHPKLALWLLSPAFAVRDDAKEQRRSAMAQCLLRLAEKEYNEAHGKVMADRAFELMRFNPHEIQQGIERITKLHRFIGTESPFMMNLLLLVERAVQECTNYYTEDIWEQESFRRVLFMYFSAALGARRWKTAATAATMMPDGALRSEHLKRLVRHMVDNGALAELVKMCASPEDEMSDARLQGIDMYATAMACLGALSPHLSYLNSVEGQEPSSDYQGALFALHVANDKWKRAAESLDARCVHARGALERGIESAQAPARERLVARDLALSAMGRSIAMACVGDKDDTYLVSGKAGTYATLPLKLLGDTTPNRQKRIRNIGLESKMEESEIKDRVDSFMLDEDIDLAAIRSVCFQILQTAGRVGSAEGKAFLMEPVSRATDQLLISELFKGGYFQYGLLMGKALRASRNGHYGGMDVFHDAASHLSCGFLVPLMLGKESLPNTCIEQMRASLNALVRGESCVLPPLAKSLNASDASSNCIRQLAGEILRHVTISYTTSTTPLAHDVVDCLLSEHGPAILPEWLHNLMVHGTPCAARSPSGLFAKRANSAQAFLGDPSSLVTKYTYAGMYEEACRTVNETLDVRNTSSSAAQRLPEKGDMDFVPYPKIDLLYNLIDASIQRDMYSGDQAARLKKAQKELEDNLERHFELLEISEMGIKSARALRV